MDQFWWGFLAGSPIGAIAGAALVLVGAALIKTRPMDGRTWTGDLHTHPITQLFKDADHKGDR